MPAMPSLSLKPPRQRKAVIIGYGSPPKFAGRGGRPWTSVRRHGGSGIGVELTPEYGKMTSGRLRNGNTSGFGQQRPESARKARVAVTAARVPNEPGLNTRRPNPRNRPLQKRGQSRENMKKLRTVPVAPLNHRWHRHETSE